MALGLYGDFFFFAVASRLPFCAAILASASIAFFLVVVAYRTWAGIVIAVIVVFTVLLGLQYLVKGGELLYALLFAMYHAIEQYCVSISHVLLHRQAIPTVPIPLVPAQLPAP